MADASTTSVTSVEVLSGSSGSPNVAQTYPYVFTDGITDYFTVTYSYGVSANAEGQILDAPVLFTRADAPFVLKIFTTETVTQEYPANSLSVSFYNDADQGLLLGADPALSFLDGVLIVWSDSASLHSSATGTWALEDDGTYSFSLEMQFDQALTRFPAVTSDTNADTIYERTRSSVWDGYLSFIMNIATEITVTNVTLTGWSIPFNTGWLGHPAERGRPVWDHITGLPTFAQDCSESGFYPGLWTEPKSWDAEEPRNIQPVELPDTEGELDDDFPQ